MNMDDLIQRQLDGLNSPPEAAELSQLLETDAAVRSRYLDLAELHAALAAGALRLVTGDDDLLCLDPIANVDLRIVTPRQALDEIGG